jgi:hypothetical protein
MVLAREQARVQARKLIREQAREQATAAFLCQAPLHALTAHPPHRDRSKHSFLWADARSRSEKAVKSWQHPRGPQQSQHSWSTKGG